MKITLMVKSGMVDVVECPEDVEIVLRDYDHAGCINDERDLRQDEDGDMYLLIQLN